MYPLNCLLSAYKGLKQHISPPPRPPCPRLLSAYKGLKQHISPPPRPPCPRLLSAYKGLKRLQEKDPQRDNKAVY